MMKDNIVKIDWDDEILSKTALTHDGKMKNEASEPHVKPDGGDRKSMVAPAAPMLSVLVPSETVPPPVLV